MKSFITALQFLTRLHVKEQPGLTVEDFGRSTKFFPLVGVLLGLIYLLVGPILSQQFWFCCRYS